jgi:hypothetical protein
MPVLILLLLTFPAWAGDCKHESIGDQGVTTCEDGSVTVQDRHGVRQYGQRNQGQPRYPYSWAPAYAVRPR